MELDQIDFQQLRVKHILFKTKVRALLYGGVYDEALFSSQNPVDVWFATIGKERYAHAPEINQLYRVHHNLVFTARSLYGQYSMGLIEQAHEELKNVDLQSEKFLLLLAQMEQNHTAK
jgi:hypothetical protein